jgi:hypothetical protein
VPVHFAFKIKDVTRLKTCPADLFSDRMADPAMDFQCRVATYELWRADELAAKQGRPIFEPPNMPHLVAVSRAKVVRPTRQALNLAVGLLLRTQMPKWHAAQKRRTKEFAKLVRRFGRKGAIEQQSSNPLDLDAQEFSNLERNVFLISRHIGLLHENEFFPDFEREDTLIHESLEHWINAAQDIQTMFSELEAHRGVQEDIERAVGQLTIFLALKSNGASVHLRPENTQDALIYHAAQMIAAGTRFQTCEVCGTPFFGGGPGREKRARTLFCSDKCRWTHHNKVRQKGIGNHRDAD